MRFLISRTSQYAGEEPPCEGAVESQAVWVDRRTVKTLEEARAQFWGPGFFRSGTNHRVEDGGVARDMEPGLCWTIEIENLHALMGLIDREGDVVVSYERENRIGEVYPPKIEIYDTYRE